MVPRIARIQESRKEDARLRNERIRYHSRAIAWGYVKGNPASSLLGAGGPAPR